MVEEPGYLYVYLSNESETPSEVYFDDFTVSVSESRIVQLLDYYPYGMVANSWVRSGEKATREMFQGKPYEEVVALSHFGARQYDAALGRWHAMDPANQFASPYTGMGNSPVMGVDPDGRWFGIDDAIVAGLGFVGGYVSHGIATGHWGKRALVSGAITAGVSWLSYNTAGMATGLLMKAGVTSSAASVLGSGIGGAVSSFTGSVAGQLAFNGNIDMGTAGQAALYGFGGGLASGMLDLAPFMDKTYPMHHTVEHITRSTVYQAGGNLITGNNPFRNNTFGVDPSIIFPVLMDGAALTSKYWARPAADKVVQDTKEVIMESSGTGGGQFAHVKVESFDYLDADIHEGGLSVQMKNAKVTISGRARINYGPLKGTVYDSRLQMSWSGRFTYFSKNKNFNHSGLFNLYSLRRWW